MPLRRLRPTGGQLDSVRVYSKQAPPLFLHPADVGSACVRTEISEDRTCEYRNETHDGRGIRSGSLASEFANAVIITQFIIQHVCVGVEGISLRKSNSRPEVNELF